MISKILSAFTLNNIICYFMFISTLTISDVVWDYDNYYWEWLKYPFYTFYIMYSYITVEIIRKKNWFGKD